MQVTEAATWGCPGSYRARWTWCSMPRLKRPSARFSGVSGSCSMPWLKRLVTVFSGVLGDRSTPQLKRPVNRFSRGVGQLLDALAEASGARVVGPLSGICRHFDSPGVGRDRLRAPAGWGRPRRAASATARRDLGTPAPRGGGCARGAGAWGDQASADRRHEAPHTPSNLRASGVNMYSSSLDCGSLG